ncbi:MAG TPA: GyrI-like domain-containing protein [Candidatus Polarisedimenticolaceae bacterium]|nr:GyrI-like domain-containing protein [Candidatus Polarisedimenticolaceae bacterium]
MASETPEKIDLFKLHKDDYRASGTPELVFVGTANYLVVRGHGEPGGECFESRVQALYGMAYTLKFTGKAAGHDFVVGKLEGLYGVDGQSIDDLARLAPQRWNWRLMIRVPDRIRPQHVTEARRTLDEKGKAGDFDAVTLESIDEGRCVQMLHVGPYEQESRTVAAMRELARRNGLAAHTWHHEIYLSDPRRVPAAKLRTILREPVR